MGTVEDIEIIFQLIGFPTETEWLEFKRDAKDPQTIGKDISALANAAAFHDRPFAYKIWGVSDGAHELVGTSFRPLSTKAVGNQDLPIWLKQHLSPNANYEFIETDHDGKHFVILKIAAATYQPVRFDSHTFIREGSATTPLSIGSEKESVLWRKLQRTRFEHGTAEEDLAFPEIEEKLFIDEYFDLLNMRRPSDTAIVTEAFVRQGLLIAQDNGCFSITNLGALLIARRLSDFPTLRKRRLRVIRFQGDARTTILNDDLFEEGYALALPLVRNRILSHLAQEEVHEGAFRRTRTALPEGAIRELLSNVAIHQDLNDTSRSPEVHVFDNRIEFANPGAMLIPTERIVNAQPKTRNEALVNILRQMDLCEEGGTGWDIIIGDCEERHIMAPKITSSEEGGTRVVLYAGSPFARMSKKERREAAYWHSCLMLTRDSALTNASLRERFGLDSNKKDLVAISRLIRECCEEGLIHEEDPEASKRNMRYLPFWA